MKKFVSVAIMVFMVLIAFAQMPAPLPNDPEVKTGKLENGMTYYIRHNAIPEGRAEFYLATHAGAIQEGEGQDGLAHFLEHMCFNGLKNLPGKQMLDYLQHIGAEFGRNINASTGVEVTQYMLNNMPVVREGIIDTCLLVMHDYSHFVLNEAEEIDAERGVILEEKRTRNNAGWRMFEKSAPYIYGQSSKYATCNIIGSEQTLKTFQRPAIVDFYQTWYRPDTQALIVVGDIDVDQIYNKIVKLFADIPAPVNPKEKIMPDVEYNEEPVVGIITDPENTNTSVEFIWKLGEPVPYELAGTIVGYVDRMVKRMISSVMSERFEDITSKADAPFLGAGMNIANLCEKCECVEGEVVIKGSDTIGGVTAFLIEMEKLKRYGVTDDELDRVKADLVKYYETKVAGASTRKNAEFVRPIMNSFFRGTNYLAPEMELQIVQALCAQLNASAINSKLPELLKGEHLSIIYQGVDKPDQVHPSQEQLLACLSAAASAEIEAPKVEAINKDFMQGQQYVAGKVVKEAKGDYDSVVWTLSNGLKVVVKPTQFKKDQVIFSLSKNGGLSLVPTSDLASFDRSVSQSFNAMSGIAGFSTSTVTKMLSGKTVSVSPNIGSWNNGISGSCDPTDFETAMQLVYLYFAAPRFDQEEWNVAMNQIRSVLPNMVTTPNYAFTQHIYKALYNSERVQATSLETVEKANLETYAKYYRKMFANVAGATLYITGNVDPEVIKPYVEKYCGAIAGGKKASAYNKKNLIKYVKGVHSDVFEAKMNTPKVSVAQFYNADVKYSIQKEVDLKAADFVLDMIYVATLREEEGGTYGASAAMQISYEPDEDAIIQVVFDTNEEQQAKLRELAVSGLKGLAENGPSEEQLTRAIENAKKNLPEQRINNNYWQKALKYNAKRGGDYDAEYEAAINNISAQGIKDAVSEILKQGNFSEVVMTPAK